VNWHKGNKILLINDKKGRCQTQLYHSADMSKTIAFLFTKNLRKDKNKKFEEGQKK